MKQRPMLIQVFGLILKLKKQDLGFKIVQVKVNL